MSYQPISKQELKIIHLASIIQHQLYLNPEYDRMGWEDQVRCLKDMITTHLDSMGLTLTTED